jgi:septin family protein
MLKMAHSWSKGLRSSPLLLVRFLLTVIRRDFNTRPAEIELEEDRTCISLTIVDTPGFGDDIDNEAR